MKLTNNFVVTGKSATIETQFLFPVRVDDGYEIALSGFSCGGVCNVDSVTDRLFLKNKKEEVTYTVRIPHGHYPTVGTLMEVIGYGINKTIKKNDWRFNEATVKFKAANATWYLKLPEGLAIVARRSVEENVLSLLHVPDGDYVELTAPEAPFEDSIEQAFIYSSVVEESYIDGRLSRLLATVPVSKSRAFTYFEPTVLKFHKIAIQEFSSILIEIRGTHGQLLEFAKYDSLPNPVRNLTGLHKSMNVILNLTVRKPI